MELNSEDIWNLEFWILEFQILHWIMGMFLANGESMGLCGLNY
jgi:hypothetical protein